MIETTRKKVAFSFFLFAWQNLILMTGFPGNASFSCFLLVFRFSNVLTSRILFANRSHSCCIHFSTLLLLSSFTRRAAYDYYYSSKFTLKSIYKYSICKCVVVKSVRCLSLFLLELFSSVLACMQHMTKCYVFIFFFPFHFISFRSISKVTANIVKYCYLSSKFFFCQFVWYIFQRNLLSSSDFSRILLFRKKKLKLIEK